MSKHEKREMFLQLKPNTRAEENATEKTELFGYAAVFNQLAHNERIAPGAFTKTLQESKDIKAYMVHDSRHLLARTNNDTLSLWEDDHGLAFNMKPNLKTVAGSDAMAYVERGDIDQMSFGFWPITVTSEIVDGEEVFTIKEVRLTEISLVPEPWYDTTAVTSRDKGGDTAEPEPDNHSTHDDLTSNKRKREIEMIKLGVNYYG